jgi:hypothetical protein
VDSTKLKGPSPVRFQGGTIGLDPSEQQTRRDPTVATSSDSLAGGSLKATLWIRLVTVVLQHSMASIIMWGRGLCNGFDLESELE